MTLGMTGSHALMEWVEVYRGAFYSAFLTKTLLQDSNMETRPLLLGTHSHPGIPEEGG